MEPSEQKTVLLVEDDQSIRELYAMAFLNAGLKVLVAENGKQGLTLALDEKPALILLDIDMPIMNGYEMCDQLRADAWGQAVPVIFLTNRSDPRDVAHAAPQGPIDYIVKANIPVRDVVNKVLTTIGEKPVA